MDKGVIENQNPTFTKPDLGSVKENMLQPKAKLSKLLEMGTSK